MKFSFGVVVLNGCRLTTEALFRALWGLAFFLLVEVFIFIPLYIVGLPLAYLAEVLGAATVEVPSMMDASRMVTAYRNPVLNWWVGNHEDGIQPVFGWWVGRSRLAWFLRNPACNLRFTPLVSTKPSPDTHHIGSVDAVPADGVPGWFLAWSGPYVGFLWQCSTWGLWIGWKINPRDARYVPAEDYRRWGLGTACQLMRF